MASLGTLIGAQLPKESAPDSWNRLSTLLGDDETDRPWVMEYSSNHVLSVRSGKWKYIDPSDGPAMIPWGPKIETGNLSTPQLYLLENVAEKYPAKVFELQKIARRVCTSSIYHENK